MRLLSLLVLASFCMAQAPLPKREFTGVWALGPAGRQVSPDDTQSPGGEIPPMTAWAKERYDKQRPGYGKRAAPGGNDPILQCDPIGFPRILYFPAPFEFFTANNRVLQLFERDHVLREIWTDGRALQNDPDPLWYGYSSGKWVDDNTLTVESNGFDERTWMGSTGYVHSEAMKVEERYHRVDENTIDFTITITDPMAYTKPWVPVPRQLRRRNRVEIRQGFCVASEEAAFTKRIREPGAKK